MCANGVRGAQEAWKRRPRQEGQERALDHREVQRHVRRDGLDLLKKLQKDGHVSKDDLDRQSDLVQKATDQHIGEIDQGLTAKEKEIMQV